MRGSQNDSVRACVSMHLAGMLIMVRGNDGLVVRCKQDVRPTARLRQRCSLTSSRRRGSGSLIAELLDQAGGTVDETMRRPARRVGR
jgi:hypothetical protein